MAILARVAHRVQALLPIPLLMLLTLPRAWAQPEAQTLRLLTDSSALELANASAKALYNMEFGTAQTLAFQLEGHLPNHPAPELIMALINLYREIPLQPGTKAFDDYTLHLKNCRERANHILDDEPDNVEGTFFSLAASSFLARHYAENDDYLGAVQEGLQTYKYMRAGFSLTQAYPEFYFSTGLYNFYREQYPETHPNYQAFMWLFPEGNKALGLQQLEQACQQAIFTRTEAEFFLAHIPLRYGNNPALAVKRASALVQRLPNNHYYKILLAEAYVANGQYTEALPVAMAMTKQKRTYYRLAGQVLQGIIEEKQLKKPYKAKGTYLYALQLAQELNQKKENFKSMAYLGLGRLEIQEGHASAARRYLGQAIETAEYDQVINEAKMMLDMLDAP